MRARSAMALMVLLATAQLAAAARDKNSQFTPAQLEGFCNEKGGTWFAPSAEGVYACLLPDGTLISCGGLGAFLGCTATRLGGKFDLKQQVAVAGLSDRSVAIKLDELAGQVAALLDGQRQLTARLAALQSPSCVEPDLLPLPSPGAAGPTGFCRRDEQGRLHVFVTNPVAGTSVAASTTRVTFDCVDPSACASRSPIVVDHPTPALTGPDGVAEFVLDIPPGCFDPATNECAFAIVVDVAGVITESDESNDRADGVCGPLVF